MARLCGSVMRGCMVGCCLTTHMLCCTPLTTFTHCNTYIALAHLQGGLGLGAAYDHHVNGTYVAVDQFGQVNGMPGGSNHFRPFASTVGGAPPPILLSQSLSGDLMHHGPSRLVHSSSNALTLAANSNTATCSATNDSVKGSSTVHTYMLASANPAPAAVAAAASPGTAAASIATPASSPVAGVTIVTAAAPGPAHKSTDDMKEKEGGAVQGTGKRTSPFSLGRASRKPLDTTSRRPLATTSRMQHTNNAADDDLMAPAVKRASYVEEQY